MKFKKIIRALFSIQNQCQYKVLRILGLKIKWKRKSKIDIRDIEKRLLILEKLEVMHSGLFDANYYIKQYYPNIQTMAEALDHYMSEGYKMLNNPSQIFDAKAYDLCSENPIIHYLVKGRYEKPRMIVSNIYIKQQSDIDGYWLDKQKRQSKKVVYTCIVNDYDDLNEIKAFYYIDSSWDYVCFTNNKEHIIQKRVGIWEIRPLIYENSNNTKNNRWHKLHPHILFPNYEESIYIDSNINVLTSKLFDMVRHTKKDILLPFHFARNCIYKELNCIKHLPLGLDINIIEKQYKIMKDAGFPENYGLFENNIIYRKHLNSEIIKMMEEWWNLVLNYCQRDQTSLVYIFWKFGRKIDGYGFKNARVDYKNFVFYPHKKKV